MNRLIHILVFCTISIFIPVQARAHTTNHLVKVKNWSTDEGLTQKMIYNVVQDEDGFMWIATWNGLERFDGYEFRNFKSHPTDSMRLLSNRMPSISTGPKNGLWCQTYDQKIYVFDTRREKFIDPFSKSANPSVSSADMWPTDSIPPQTSTIQTVSTHSKMVWPTLRR